MNLIKTYQRLLDDLKPGEVDYICHDPVQWVVREFYNDLKALAKKDNMLDIKFEYSYVSDVYFIKVTKINNSVNILKEL